MEQKEIKEEWRPVVGYEGLYEVSNFGRIVACEKIDKSGILRKRKILKPCKRKGYCIIGLGTVGNRKTRSVHRLVAEAFIPNPQNFPQVNHKDENKSNNNIDNLEWCTNDYNIHYGSGIIRKSHGVVQLSKSHEIINKYNSILEASKKTGIAKTSIYNAAHGRQNSAGGFLWMYISVGKRNNSENVIKSRNEEKWRNRQAAYIHRKSHIEQYNSIGEKICEYKNVKDAAVKLGVSNTTVIRACAGKGRCKGFYLKYKLKNNEE